jgi:toxin ParE1/3/4
MHVIWTERAVSHLTDIQRFIELDKSEAARKLIQKILTHVDQLVQHPYLGRPGSEPDTRELIIPGSPYIVTYRIDRGRLGVLAVFQRSPPQTLRGVVVASRSLTRSRGAGMTANSFLGDAEVVAGHFWRLGDFQNA